jgi:L-amino acid N-acyltransferase YncA
VVAVNNMKIINTQQQHYSQIADIYLQGIATDSATFQTTAPFGKVRMKAIAGFQLLNLLILSSEQNGLWTLQSGIFPENVSSIKLHENVAFASLYTVKKQEQ